MKASPYTVNNCSLSIFYEILMVSISRRSLLVWFKWHNRWWDLHWTGLHASKYYFVLRYM